MAQKKKRAVKKKTVKRSVKKKRIRATLKKDVETAILLKSKRRCCLCFGINNDSAEKEGQIAHLNQDPSDSREVNLVFLCMNHHSRFDSTTSQHKNFTKEELVHYRKTLYEYLAEEERKAREGVEWEEQLERRRREAMLEIEIQEAKDNLEWKRKHTERLRDLTDRLGVR